MFASLIDDIKLKVENALKLVFAGAIASAAAMAAFICFAVALFLWVQQTYGTLEAWIAIGAVFAFVAAIGGVVILAVQNRRPPPQPRPQETRPVSRLLQDPTVLVTGVQIARILGARGLLPLILLGIVAGGFLMSRNGHSDRAHHERGGQESEWGEPPV